MTNPPGHTGQSAETPRPLRSQHPPHRSARAFIIAGLIACLILIAAPFIYSSIALPAAKPRISPEFAKALEKQVNAFQSQGVQVGQPMPDLEAHPLEADQPNTLPRQPLRTLWKSKPTILITASITCDLARDQQPLFNKLAKRFKGLANFAILYTLEAHPTGSPSPYPQSGSSNPANLAPQIAHPQHQSLADRALAANDYHRLLDTRSPIYLDPMADAAWHAFGAGPNVAVIITPNGKVAFKQAWLDTDKLQKELELLVSSGT